ncbi:MAG: hypothetical protein R8G34_07480 [Paracoccaceae bacterium]|nr:hypothetical protein [Paracoccaceae bacterium]
MTPRVYIAGLALATLSACASVTPDYGTSNAANSSQAQLQRETALATNPFDLPEAAGQPLGSPLPGSAEATAAETTRVLEQTRAGATQGSVPAPPTVSGAASTAAVNNPGISDENNFDAVAERQTIESDAERIASNAAQYEVVQPEALPTRSTDAQPNIVAFALETKHPKGQSVYARAGFGGESRAERNCADYASPDLAQIDFLGRGGPVRDRRGLDPDGDGYACTWDPAPFRRASGG